MGNLFTSLLNTAGAMDVYSRQFAAIQNNVSNANTPGYVRQTQILKALPFDVDHGLPGGVAAGAMVSSRSDFADSSVRSQFSELGLSEQKSADLARIQPLFDLSAGSGVAGSLANFFQSFSNLSINPNDTLSRQSVLDNAQAVADSFHQTATGLANIGADADRQIGDAVGNINQLAGQLQAYNAKIQQNSQNASDAGMDASIHATLEQLSEYADIAVNREANGTFSVYLGGQAPLVIGDRQFQIQEDNSSAQTTIRDPFGKDITPEIRYGKLAGALQEKNQLIPSYTSDLNTLAQALSDQVNQQLAAGVDINGNAPVSNLFTYDSTTGAAGSMGVGPLTSDQIAAATPQAPGGNGNALNVADMQSAKLINGSTFTEYFGGLGGRVGRDIANAQNDKQSQQQLLDQARSLRQEVSGVSLDDEAAHLLQVQRAYQAAGKVMTVLNDTMDSLMQMIR